jgi:hypothetical protein
VIQLTIVDGFGTYDDETMAGAVMSYVGSRGYYVGVALSSRANADDPQWFLTFQLFVNGTSPH